MFHKWYIIFFFGQYFCLFFFNVEVSYPFPILFLSGSWWNAKVEAIDASLVKVIFVVNQRKELIYRGSTRLFPLYKQMQQQKKNAGTQHFAR